MRHSDRHAATSHSVPTLVHCTSRAHVYAAQYMQHAMWVGEKAITRQYVMSSGTQH